MSFKYPWKLRKSFLIIWRALDRTEGWDYEGPTEGGTTERSTKQQAGADEAKAEAEAESLEGCQVPYMVARVW